MSAMLLFLEKQATQPSASQSSNSTQTQELESDDEQLPEHASIYIWIAAFLNKPVEDIEAKGPTKSIGKYLADLYKVASDASANTAKVLQYEIKSWYNYANKFENRVKELIKTGVKEKVARTAVYEEIEPFLLASSKINLCQKTHKARNILYLFSNIGVDKI
ncbi:hypothetical protein C2G38_2182131 [Gigaspora rosea]|uniref:Uncharacterized protein n=1 Tax=Gigaspora rosea TaxID=44941 RepID=A0A397VDE1_9GLOM|nr:hypothetical protein C2G38_2182131 [Gigaspora rosea]